MVMRDLLIIGDNLPLKAQATLLTLPGGRFQKKLIAVGKVTRYPYDVLFTISNLELPEF
jgi:hypothetical protein